jgi:hypothetical protein
MTTYTQTVAQLYTIGQGGQDVLFNTVPANNKFQALFDFRNLTLANGFIYCYLNDANVEFFALYDQFLVLFQDSFGVKNITISIWSLAEDVYDNTFLVGTDIPNAYVEIDYDGSTVTIKNLSGTVITTASAPLFRTGYASFTPFYVEPTDTGSISLTFNITGTFTPAIEVSPIICYPENNITVTGFGFQANSPLELTVTNFYTGESFTIANWATSDGSGNIPTGSFFYLPLSTINAQSLIEVSDSANNAGYAAIFVNAIALCSPSTGEIGTTVTISGGGFVNGSAVTLTTNMPNLVEAISTGATTGSCSFSFVIPETAAPIEYRFTLTDDYDDAATTTLLVTAREYDLNVFPIVMSLSALLDLDWYDNYPCGGCGKSIIVKEGIVEGTDINHCWLVCEFCSHYVNSDGTMNLPAILAAMVQIVSKAINPETSDEVGYPWV